MAPEHFWWGGWWMFPMAMPIVVLVVALVLLYLIFGRGGSRPPCCNSYNGGHPQGRESESALEVLKKRYARGEISKEEFEQIKKDL